MLRTPPTGPENPDLRTTPKLQPPRPVVNERLAVFRVSPWKRLPAIAACADYQSFPVLCGCVTECAARARLRWLAPHLCGLCGSSSRAHCRRLFGESSSLREWIDVLWYLAGSWPYSPWPCLAHGVHGALWTAFVLIHWCWCLRAGRAALRSSGGPSHSHRSAVLVGFALVLSWAPGISRAALFGGQRCCGMPAFAGAAFMPATSTWSQAGRPALGPVLVFGVARGWQAAGGSTDARGATVVAYARLSDLFDVGRKNQDGSKTRPKQEFRSSGNRRLEDATEDRCRFDRQSLARRSEFRFAGSAEVCRSRLDRSAA